jgi:hypothetical protein
MHRSSENSDSNDIVSELGIQGVGFGGQGAYGAPWFNVQGYSGMGDTFAATPMHAWDTLLEVRDSLSWQLGHHSLKLGGSYRNYIWPMWGFFKTVATINSPTASPRKQLPTTERFSVGQHAARPPGRQTAAGAEFRRCNCASGTQTRSFRTAFK